MYWICTLNIYRARHEYHRITSWNQDDYFYEITEKIWWNNGTKHHLLIRLQRKCIDASVFNQQIVLSLRLLYSNDSAHVMFNSVSQMFSQVAFFYIFHEVFLFKLHRRLFFVCPVDNTPELVQVMTWCFTGDMLLHGPLSLNIERDLWSTNFIAYIRHTMGYHFSIRSVCTYASNTKLCQEEA